MRAHPTFSDLSVLVGVSEAKVLVLGDRFGQHAEQLPICWAGSWSDDLGRQRCGGCSAPQARR